MIRPRSLRRLGWCLGLSGALALGVLALPGAPGHEARAADEVEREGAFGYGEEGSGPVRVAGSICEAQELKALAKERPDLRIEIPPEYDKPYPSLSACRSHEAAWDPDAPGPMQPIPFSHAHHAGEYEIPCGYCHTGTERSPAAGVPSVELCMGCHAQFSNDYDQELEGIRILKEHWGHSYEQAGDGEWKIQPRDPEAARPIEWEQIHWVPEHVQFKHNRHVAAGVECQRCHGPVETMDKLYLTDDTVWWPYGLPSRKLEMGWCIQCHREQGASQDCLTCHY